MGLGNEGTELKVSRAYIAGLGTTGVLIGSFLLLLTVGSALVAFQGVPGQATNGDLSSIELRQQSERAAQGDWRTARGKRPGRRLRERRAGRRLRRRLRRARLRAARRRGASLAPTAAVGRCAAPGLPHGTSRGSACLPSDGQTSAPGTGVLATPPVSSDESSGSGSDAGSGSSGSGDRLGHRQRGTGRDRLGAGSDTGSRHRHRHGHRHRRRLGQRLQLDAAARRRPTAGRRQRRQQRLGARAAARATAGTRHRHGDDHRHGRHRLGAVSPAAGQAVTDTGRRPRLLETSTSRRHADRARSAACPPPPPR